MATDKLTKAINDQINMEFFSAYLYLSMATYYQDEHLPGFAKWMKVQAKEEVEHAMKFIGYLQERGEKVELAAISAPGVNWKDSLSILEASLKHEKQVTASINKIMDQAVAAKDYPAVDLLTWFCKEQVEEENNFTDLIADMKRVGTNGPALIMMDRALALRSE